MDLFNTIYDTGILPSVWLKLTLVIIPKKNRAVKCCEHRTMSLMSHIFLRVIQSRVHKVLEEKISETQLAFRNSLGTREDLYDIQVLVHFGGFQN